VTASADQLKQAAMDGRAAVPGSKNPYAGQGALARAWRSGYRRMLFVMMETSPAHLNYLAAKKETPQP